MVTAWGMAAETAADGAEALEKLAAVPVDVILTDLNMPGMDGYELLEKLRNLGDAPPAIVITAYGTMDSGVKTVHELGAFWFLEKPIQPNTLEALVRRAASHGRLAQRQSQPGNATALQRIARRSGGRFLEDAGDLRAAAAGGTEQGMRADHRRKRHRKGDGGARASQAEPAPAGSVPRDQLRRAAGEPDRERAVRPRKGLVHRRHGALGRLLRAGAERHAAARRNRRDAGAARRPSCCAFSKIRRCGAWAARTNSKWTCAWSPPPTRFPTTR